jgi:divalent metal cation (Fe/Co/Zn/Cd) transporter
MEKRKYTGSRDAGKKRYRQALGLEYFTVGYNAVEAIVSIIAGRLAGSIALVGFGMDSIVESLSGLVLIWRLRKHEKLSKEEEEKVEQRAERFVGITFFLLAAYILFESVRKIVLKDIPDPSLFGIIIAVVSLIVMPFLGAAKHKLGEKLSLRSLIADAKETFVCSVLSLALLLGLLGNYLFGFWLADPLVGIITVLYLVKEGRELLFKDKE